MADTLSNIAGPTMVGASVGGPWGAAIGAGVGILKSLLIDQPAQDRNRKLQAATARYSPWTHLTPGAVGDADPLGSALTFGATGANIGAGIDQGQMNQKMQNAWLDLIKSQTVNTAPQPVEPPSLPYIAPLEMPKIGYQPQSPYASMRF